MRGRGDPFFATSDHRFQISLLKSGFCFLHFTIFGVVLAILLISFPHYSFAGRPNSSTDGKIEAILRRSASMGSLSGLVNIKVRSPKIKKKIKAAVLLNREGLIKIEGLSLFGSPIFYFVYIKNNLLIHFPTSGMLYIDQWKNDELSDFLNFPKTEYSFLELISGCLLTRKISGEITLMEINDGKEFELFIKPENNTESCEMALDPSLLPKGADILKGEGGISIAYSDYRQIDGFSFPFHSIFKIPEKEIIIEFSFRNMRLADKFPRKQFRIPVRPDNTSIDREDIVERLNALRP